MDYYLYLITCTLLNKIGATFMRLCLLLLHYCNSFGVWCAIEKFETNFCPKVHALLFFFLLSRLLHRQPPALPPTPTHLPTLCKLCVSQEGWKGYFVNAANASEFSYWLPTRLLRCQNIPSSLPVKRKAY